MTGILIVISAPSGTGKSTLTRLLLSEFKNVEFSISYTTREPRENEVNGKDYFFVSEETFRKMIDEGDFLEWANVYGNLYGTSKTQVMRALKEGKDILLDIDTQGALNVKRSFPEAVLIFLLPPSFGELERRLRSRGTDSEEEIERRLKTARDEVRKALLYDYIIVNDEVELAYGKLKAIIVAEKCRSLRVRENLAELIRDREMIGLIEGGNHEENPS